MSVSIIDKLQTIFQDVKVSEFMNPDVIYVNPDKTLLHVKEIMRIKRISGVPVVDDEKRVIGIVSLEDIIKALEGSYIKDKVGNRMTKSVVCLKEEDTLQNAVKTFERYGYGRFPVVNEEGKLVGIVTKHDIIYFLLAKLGIMYLHDKRMEEVLEKGTSLVTGEVLEKGKADFVFHIDYFDVNMVGVGASKLKKFLLSQGVEEELARKVAIATYEAEANVVIHSESDGYIYCFIDDEKITVRVEDRGKGIENLELAMKEGYSTAPDHIRELGFGAGMGLPNMRRYSDKMVIISEVGKGVIVEMVFFRRDRCENRGDSGEIEP
ncbi:CBS domain-containing protein [Thermotoga sp. KOL6]|uniref:CBS domain-containing protein n=1 Tax=Thermotoga sp. KOL6 TaxID=126741 RepID=UPI000C75F151|nr:CBS domain-containing protein [Thermotoga sp. KOL6]PLV60007.1 serine/threonine protein kinase [Thermotoga sp. KOL6]